MPDKVKVPAPVLVSAPVVLVLAPEIVKVVPDAVTSIVLVVPAVKVKARSVEAVAPVYFKVPPPSTKLAASLADAPMLLLDKPLAIDEILKVPPLIVVTPL